MMRVFLKPVALAMLAFGLVGCAGGPTFRSPIVFNQLVEQDVERAETFACAAPDRPEPQPFASAPDMTYPRGAAAGYGTMTAGGMVSLSMMMGLAPELSLEEQTEIEAKVQNVLENDLDGRSVQWVSPRSGLRIRFSPKATKSEFRKITVARSEGVGRVPESFKVESGRYRTTQSTLLRPTPSSAADFGYETVPANKAVDVIGRVGGLYGDSWLMVAGLNGAAYGYIDPADLTPLSATEEAELYNPITAGVIRDPVDASVTCRTLVYESAQGEEVVRACRNAEGRWIADPPAAGEGRCLPVNASFLLGNAP
jgi:hypothetical protein